jgi:hypothetical protein
MQDFTSQKWKFKTRFPGKPDEKTQPGPQGISMTAFYTESRSGAMLVGVADMPIPENEPNETIQERLDGSRDGAIRNVGGTLKSSQAITLNGKYPGREFSATLTTPAQGQMRCKVFLVNRRLYQVLVLGTDSFVTSQKADEFLNSFQLID